MQIALQTSGDQETLLANIQWAQTLGVVAVALPDHYLMTMGDGAYTTAAFDALIQLGALAVQTTSIEISVLVSPVTFRHPAVLAKSALTIDHLSGGRFSLGVGTGWFEHEHEVFGIDLPPVNERFAVLEEALAYVSAVFDPAHPGHSGTHFSLDPVPTLPRPVRGHVPIIVGGIGRRRTPQLAGTYAHEYNCYPAPPDKFRARVRLAREAASAAGRDPDELLISSSGNVIAAETETGYRTALAQVANDGGITVAELESHMNQRNTPRGTYEQVRLQLADLAAAGMRRFYLQRGPDLDQDADAALIRALTA